MARWTALLPILVALLALRPPESQEPSSAVSPELLKGYVGASRCGDCHEEIHAKWDSSRHSKMVRPATPEGVRGDFSLKRIILRGDRYGLEAGGGDYFITESKLYGDTHKHRILYTLGNRRIQHYLTELEDGRVVVLPPTWDILRKEWFHNMEIVGPDPADGLAVQVWNKNCFGCHVSQERRHFDLETKTYATDWVDFGISCERCHGPAQAHVERYRETEGVETAVADIADIVVQTRLDHVTNTMVCAQCHSLRDTIAPGFRAGENYFDYFLPQLEYSLPRHHDPAWYVDGKTRRFSSNALGIWQSRCFLEGKIACTDCHVDVHRPEIEENARLRPENNALCTRCHEGIGRALTVHTRHEATSAGSSCIECHMPQSVVSIKATMRDHSISVPAPENTERFGIPNACNLCHDDESPAWAVENLNAWFPGTGGREKLIQRAETFTRARQGSEDAVERLVALAADASEPPLIRANAVGYMSRYTADPRVFAALVRALASDDPLIRAVAASQLGQLPRSLAERAQPFLVRALDDERRAVRMGAAFSLMNMGIHELSGDAQQKFESAKQIYIARAATSPDHAPTQLDLGKFHLQNRDLVAAAEAFETSLHLDPDQENAMYYRALARLGQGRPDEARELLKKVGEDSEFHASAQALLRNLSERQR